MEASRQDFRPALLLGTMLVLPVAVPVLFAWLDAFFAAVLCCVLVLLGWQPGLKQLRYGLGGAALAALLLQQLELFLFSLSTCPLAMVLAKGVERQESAARSGARGLVALAAGWLLFWLCFALLTQTNPYRGMLEALDKGLGESLALYAREGNGLSPETLQQVTFIVESLRSRLPQFLPAMWLGMGIMTVWVNLVLANYFLGRLRSGAYPWGRYQTWRLPDQLVWLPIVAGLFALFRFAPLQGPTLWALVVAFMLYGFQGLAVSLYFFERWRFPTPVRVLAVFFLIIQGYGLMLLAMLGVSDVWLDWRNRPNRSAATDKE